MLYIIDKNTGFKGNVIGIMSDSVHVDYTGSLYNDNGPDFTLAEYAAHKGNDALIAMPWEQLSPLMEAYALSLQKPWEEISEDNYDEMRECLPPANWHDLNKRFNVFYCSEAQTGNLHGHYVIDRLTKKYYYGLRSKFITDTELLNQLTTLLNQSAK